MSVIMALRVSVDPERFLEVATGDPERLNTISQRGREHGAIHHRFYANADGGEILVLDEWPDAESFQKFFSTSPDIGQMMGEAGVTEEPQASFWRPLDTPDAF
jgi:hypothetical protein